MDRLKDDNYYLEKILKSINRIVHDYGNVLLDTVYYTLVDDIPELAVIISKCFK